MSSFRETTVRACMTWRAQPCLLTFVLFASQFLEACEDPEVALCGEANDGGTDAADAEQALAFGLLGTIPCESEIPTKVFDASPCDGPMVACDEGVSQVFAELLRECDFELNENSLEFFFSEGCAVGITLAREDSMLISPAAKACVDDRLLHMRLGCARSACLRAEHSTLAAP